jgi:hypothetical protein
LQGIFSLVNHLLLVLIIMEVLRTVARFLRERKLDVGVEGLVPFLVIGGMSAARRILAAHAKEICERCRLSTNPRQLFSRQHVDYPGSAHPRSHDHKSGVIVRHLTNHCGMAAKWMSPHGSEHSACSFGRHDC